MVAEVGGYTGLLLGVSLMDSVAVLQQAATLYTNIHNCFTTKE
jgi:hypothetical protein